MDRLPIVLLLHHIDHRGRSQDLHLGLQIDSLTK